MERRGSKIGAHSLTCYFEARSQNFTWNLTGIYGSNTRKGKKELWEEVGSSRELFDGPWVVCGDFNTTRFTSDKKDNDRLTRAMTNFSTFIEDLELIDPPLSGENLTWARSYRHEISNRLERFLISTE